MDDFVRNLIAIGASVTANCRPCLKTAIDNARKKGAHEQDIADAIKTGMMVRQGASRSMDNYVSSMSGPKAEEEKSEKASCCTPVNDQPTARCC